MEYLKKISATLLVLLIIFLILDFFNLTSWLLFPYSTATGKNNTLTTQLGNTPATGGGGN
jgi:hypothetical protein